MINNLYILLENLSSLCKLDIISTEHRTIHELALSLGGCAKPSGAGGGDLSIAWVPQASRQNFLGELSRLGFKIISQPSGKSEQIFERI